VDRKDNERQNSKPMVSYKDLFRLGKVKNNPYTRFFYSCHLYVCVFFSWLLLSHVFVHAFIRLLDFIVINGVNTMTKQHLSSSNQIIYKEKDRSFSFVILNLWRLRFLCSLFFFFLLNLARFCLLLSMTLIMCECLSICPIYCTSEQHASSHTWESWNLHLLCLFLFFFSCVFFSWLFFFFFFFAKKQVLKAYEMVT